MRCNVRYTPRWGLNTGGIDEDEENAGFDECRQTSDGEGLPGAEFVRTGGEKGGGGSH